MPKIPFKIESVDVKPPREYQKVSKYDPIIDSFVESIDDIVVVSVEGVSPDYLRTQLKKRIETRGFYIRAFVLNGEVYLERL